MTIHLMGVRKIFESLFAEWRVVTHSLETFFKFIPEIFINTEANDEDDSHGD